MRHGDLRLGLKKGRVLVPERRASGLGEPRFDAAADLNPEGCVDGYDLALLTSLWGRVVP